MIDGPRDSDLLAGAQPLPIGRMSVRILSALDQLVMVLAQRDQWDSRSRLLWATDAALILRSRGGHIGPPLESAQGPPLLESAQVSNLEAVLTRARALDLEPAAAEGWRQLRDAYGLAQVMP